MDKNGFALLVAGILVIKGTIVYFVQRNLQGKGSRTGAGTKIATPGTTLKTRSGE